MWENSYHQVCPQFFFVVADNSGTPENPGLIYLTTQELFERCAALTDKKIDISLSFLEIYNETIRDLLVPIEEGKTSNFEKTPNIALVSQDSQQHLQSL